MGKVCEGHPDALAWWESLKGAVLTWDHIVDGDEVDVALADQSFVSLMVDWSKNPFWRAYQGILSASLFTSIQAWRWSNKPDAPKIKAYDIYTNTASLIAYLLHPRHKAEEFSAEIHDLNRKLCEVDDAMDGGKK